MCSGPPLRPQAVFVLVCDSPLLRLSVCLSVTLFLSPRLSLCLSVTLSPSPRLSVRLSVTLSPSPRLSLRRSVCRLG